MNELTKDRKIELASELEYYVDRYLDKQWIVSDTIANITDDQSEREFLNSLVYYFKVDLKEG